MENELKKIRKERGISIQQCSDDTGISTRTIMRYEKGQYGQLKTAQVLADYFNVPLERIIGSKHH